MGNMVLITSAGVGAIHQERERQWYELGYSDEHDDEHIYGQLADAAMCYASVGRDEDPHPFWPWDPSHWKPGLRTEDWENLPVDSTRWPEHSISLRQRELAKAGALIAAEYDRLERLRNGR